MTVSREATRLWCIKFGVAYTKQYENNWTEQSREPARVKERVLRRFKSVRLAQKFLRPHAAVSNLSNSGRHLVRAQHYRDLKVNAFEPWSIVLA
ncbi:MAG: putative transposase [Halieaceae bacterium]|jgi:putative transposase